jgi:hypothetical protein
MRACNSFSGMMPWPSPNHTSKMEMGTMTNCGTMTPRTMSRASSVRLSRPSATCTSSSAGGLPAAGAGRVRAGRRFGVSRGGAAARRVDAAGVADDAADHADAACCVDGSAVAGTQLAGTQLQAMRNA